MPRRPWGRPQRPQVKIGRGRRGRPPQSPTQGSDSTTGVGVCGGLWGRGFYLLAFCGMIRLKSRFRHEVCTMFIALTGKRIWNVEC